MAKNGNGKQQQNQVVFATTSTTVTSAAGEYKFMTAMHNLITYFEALTTDTQEMVVTKATFNFEFADKGDTAGAFTVVPCLVISDQAIAAAAAGSAAVQIYHPADLDVCSAGNMESRRLATAVSKRWNSGAGYNVARGNIEITPHLAKVARMLARSAILATNPYASIIAIGVAQLSNPAAAISWRSELVVDYFVRPKQLRMFG
jgi:hypothetical protein